MMRNLHIHRLIVMQDGELVGMLSALDLLKILERPAQFAAFYERASV